MYKLRVIAYHNNNDPVHGITIPKEVAIFHEKTFFKIIQSGNNILLLSGTKILPEEQIKNYDFSDSRI